ARRRCSARSAVDEPARVRPAARRSLPPRAPARSRSTGRRRLRACSRSPARAAAGHSACNPVAPEGAARMAYPGIERHGVIGNMRTAALVSTEGSIDWFCCPYFDSPSVFAALLDDQKGGRFAIAPKTEEFTCHQLYWPDTNVLITRFLAGDGVGE